MCFKSMKKTNKGELAIANVSNGRVKLTGSSDFNFGVKQLIGENQHCSAKWNADGSLEIIPQNPTPRGETVVLKSNPKTDGAYHFKLFKSGEMTVGLTGPRQMFFNGDPEFLAKAFIGSMNLVREKYRKQFEAENYKPQIMEHVLATQLYFDECIFDPDVA